jgi:hypothetical protein
MKTLIKKSKGKISKLFFSMMVAMLPIMNAFVTASAAGAGGLPQGGGNAATPSQDADQTFLDLIGFFATWFGRIGLVVGFVGAIMFGLAIKDENADGKQRGLMTMISGFVVFAITLSLDLFGLL